MIEDIIGTMTPYIVKGKKLYEEEDVKRALAKMLKMTISSVIVKPVEPSELNEYPEVTC
jgi:hypothetical protein